MDPSEPQPELPSAPSTVDTPVTPTPEEPTPPPAPTFKVYRPPKSTATSPRDVPDNYFEPTKADVKFAQDSLHQRTEALVNAPFRTQQLRDAQEKARRERYPTTRIRIRFSDRTQLEKTFPSTDKIKMVYAFVRNALSEEVKATKFVLYQTPPPRELKVSDPKVRDLSLLQLQLVPTAVLYLKFLDDTLNHNNVQAPLDPTILEQAEDLPTPPNLEIAADKPAASSSKSAGRTLGSSTSGSAEKSGAKTPFSAIDQKKLGKFFKGLGPKT